MCAIESFVQAPAIALPSNLDLRELKGGWRKLHDEKLNNLYSSPNIMKAIKSRRMR
jgi:hypothetical protein